MKSVIMNTILCVFFPKSFIEPLWNRTFLYKTDMAVNEREII